MNLRAKMKASMMSQGIGSLKAENVSILVSIKALRPSRVTVPRETGNGRQRDRMGFERRGLGFEGETDEEMREKVELKKKNLCHSCPYSGKFVKVLFTCGKNNKIWNI